MFSPIIHSVMFPSPQSSYELSSFENILLINNRKCPCLFIPSARSSPVLVIYAHGNGTDLGDIRPRLAAVTKSCHVNILAFEYPGYGKYKGSTSEASVDAALYTAYTFAVNHLQWPKMNIIFWGVSIGTGPCTRLARKLSNDCGGLILQCPYKSIKHAAEQFVGNVLAKVFVGAKWNVQEDVKHVQCPVLWIHGKKDELFPYQWSEDMWRAHPEERRMIHLAPEASHLDFDFMVDIVNPIKAFLKQMILANCIYTAQVHVNHISHLRPKLSDVFASLGTNPRDIKKVEPKGEEVTAEKLIWDWSGSIPIASARDSFLYDPRCELFATIYLRIREFLSGFLKEALENGLYALDGTSVEDLYVTLTNRYYLIQPGVALNCVYKYNAATGLWIFEALLIGDQVITMTDQFGFNGFLESKYVVNAIWAFKASEYLILPLYSSPRPNLRNAVEWVLRGLHTLLDKKTYSSLEAYTHSRDSECIIESMAYDVVRKLSETRRRPLFERLVPMDGEYFGFGWDEVLNKLFGEQWPWFGSRIMMHLPHTQHMSRRWAHPWMRLPVILPLLQERPNLDEDEEGMKNAVTLSLQMNVPFLSNVAQHLGDAYEKSPNDFLPLNFSRLPMPVSPLGLPTVFSTLVPADGTGVIEDIKTLQVVDPFLSNPPRDDTPFSSADPLQDTEPRTVPLVPLWATFDARVLQCFLFSTPRVALVDIEFAVKRKRIHLHDNTPLHAPMIPTDKRDSITGSVVDRLDTEEIKSIVDKVQKSLADKNVDSTIDTSEDTSFPTLTDILNPPPDPELITPIDICAHNLFHHRFKDKTKLKQMMNIIWAKVTAVMDSTAGNDSAVCRSEEEGRPQPRTNYSATEEQNHTMSIISFAVGFVRRLIKEHGLSSVLEEYQQARCEDVPESEFIYYLEGVHTLLLETLEEIDCFNPFRRSSEIGHNVNHLRGFFRAASMPISEPQKSV